MYTLFVVAVACIAAVAGQADPLCPPVNQPVNLNNEDHSQQTVCHDYGRIRTDFKLTCDWENYDFKLELVSTGALLAADMTPQDPSVHINTGRGFTGNEKIIVPLTADEKSSCPNPNVIGSRSQQIPFVQRTPQLSASSRLEFVNGNLYYKTSVEVVETYDTQSCQAREKYRTRVNLECCLLRETHPEEIIPPIHDYCNLTYCQDPGEWTCECVFDQLSGAWVLSCLPKSGYLWSQLLSAGLSFQASHLQAFPLSAQAQAGVTPSPQLTFIRDAVPISVSPELEFGQLNTGARNPPEPWRRAYTVNPFAFHSDHETGVVMFRALLQFCRETSVDPRFPSCAPPRYKTVKG
ncbi:uncharacterized protein LOC129582954 [Paramacrobiotus metropolitanus]|uniref:uncharacterized protein LOC129582954 n=1 Tax=Paramacrobiotus metropolitanus TaxID=2943436 RepID=UPI0024457A9D|nr:uncharacterized protein LOC129582954 [Paramacrobiotus metropolitanus]